MENKDFFDDFFEETPKKKEKKDSIFELKIDSSEKEKQTVMIDTAFLLSNAIFSLLVQKGILTEEEVSEVIDDFISESD